MLSVHNIRKNFDGAVVLDGTSFEVTAGEIVGLIGPNGSGKTTLLNILSGFLAPDSGSALLHNQQLIGLLPHDIAGQGLRRTFQLPRMPQKMSAVELMLASVPQPMGRHALSCLLRPGCVIREERNAIDVALRMLVQLELQHVASTAASALSGGQQKLLALGAALLGQPRLLLLDEPTAGVNQTLRRTLADRLKTIRDEGMTLLIVEHDMGFVAEVCDRCIVLDRGKIIADCTPYELADNPRVVEAYLGNNASARLAAPLRQEV